MTVRGGAWVFAALGAAALCLLHGTSTFMATGLQPRGSSSLRENSSGSFGPWPRMSLNLDLEVHAYRQASRIEEGLIWGLGIVVICGYLTAAVRSGAGPVKRVLRFFSESEANEELKAVVEQRVTALKVSHLRLYLTMACCLCFPWTLSLLVGMAQGSFPRISTPAAEIAWLVFEAFCVAILIRPTPLSPRDLDFAYVFMVAHAVLQETPLLCCTQDGVERANVISLVCMITLNLVKGLGSRRELMLLVVSNTIFLGCVTYTRWFTFSRVETWGKLGERAGLLGLLVVLSIILAAVLEAGFRRLVTQGLQLAEAREMHKAATALLRSCYDVVVELGSSGLVNGASQDLGSLLLRADHNRSMHGVQLADLIVDDEARRQFQRRLAAPRLETVGLAESMHVTMKDALGNTLRMEMMWFACKRAEGLDHFIVGIREFSDQTQVPLGGNWSGRGEPDFFPAVASWPGADGDGDSSSSEDSDSLSEAARMDIEADLAAIFVDLTDPSYPIRGATTGFRARVGHVSRNAPLGVIVRKTEPMVNWMQNTLNSLVHSRPLPADYHVSLRVPQGTLRARCRLVAAADNENEGAPDVDVDFQNVGVLLYNITRSKSRRSGGVRELSGTPARASPDPSRIASL